MHRLQFSDLSMPIGLLVLTLLMGSVHRLARHTLAQSQPQLTTLSDTVRSDPILADGSLFWWDIREDSKTVYQYEVATRLQQPLVAPSHPAWGLASDGQTVAWVETLDGTQRIRGYHLQEQTTATVTQTNDFTYPFGVAQLALSDKVFYYYRARGVGNQPGLYAQSIETGQQERISPIGQHPTVAGNKLLWQEPSQDGTRLMLRYLNQSTADILVATVEGGIAHLAATEDYIVWSPGRRDRLMVHTLSDGTINQIVTGHVAYPLLSDTTLIWTQLAFTSVSVTYSIQALDLTTNVQHTVVATTTTPLQTHAIAAPDALFFTAHHHTIHVECSLYRTSLHQHDLVLERASDLPVIQQKPQQANPEDQIVIHDHETVFCEGTAADAPLWIARGAQFILPSEDEADSWGVSSESFSKVYDQGNRPERYQRWLDRADAIGANVLRIFIDMPGGSNPVDGQIPARLRTIYRFAYEADQRGMRVGLTFGSPGSTRFFNPTDSSKIRLRDDVVKQQWLETLLRCLNGEGTPNDPFYSESDIDHSCTIPGLGQPPNLIHTIAYINIDNEINNHCADSALDWMLIDGDGVKKPRNCYHYQTNAVDSGKHYAEAATQWVFDFKTVMEDIYETLGLSSDFTPILLTVGMSTEVYEESVNDGNNYYSDPALSAHEFLVAYTIEMENEQGEPYTESLRLIDIVDFPSPHRYSPRAPTPDDPNNDDAVITIRDTIRVSTTQPLLMEEYGAPTDPFQGGLQAAWIDGNFDRAKTDPRYCRHSDTVSSEECQDTAPGLIQRVINDIQRGYAGSIAFMLADALEDNQQGEDSDGDGIPDELPPNCSNLPPDIFTGLYAVGRGNPDDACGGTINNTSGVLKNTGYRVCEFYRGQACVPVYLPLIRK